MMYRRARYKTRIGFGVMHSMGRVDIFEVYVLLKVTIIAYEFKETFFFILTEP